MLRRSLLQVEIGFFQRTMIGPTTLPFKAEFQTISLAYLPVRCGITILLAWADSLNIVEVLSRQRICQLVLLALWVVDAVLDNTVRYVVNRLRHSFKLDSSHLNWGHQ